MKLSILIPVYNEERTVETLINRVLDAPLPGGITREVLITNDRSTDGTAQILKKFEGRKEIRIFHHEKNQGKTGALVTSLRAATGDLILIQDADLEYNPKDYPFLLTPILQGKASVVYGSRRLGSIEKMHWTNNLANRFSNWTLHILFYSSMTDVFTCYKVFRKELLDRFPITSKDFGFDSEITIKLLKAGIPILEVPIHYIARSRAEGKKMSWPRALHMYWSLIKYAFAPKIG